MKRDKSEINDKDLEQITRLIKEGYTSGNTSDESGYRIDWGIQINKFKESGGVIMPRPETIIDSLTKIIDYLEEDERKDYFANPMDEAEHIYTHVRRVRDWIQEEVNKGLNAQDVLESGPDVDRIAKYLVAQFWLGAEIGIGNSSIRDMSQEQYYELNKNEWNLKAECLIKTISKINKVNVNADFQQIRAEVKERNVLRAAIDKIREIATIGMPALALPADLTFDEKTLLNITEMCDDAIRQTDAARKK